MIIFITLWHILQKGQSLVPTINYGDPNLDVFTLYYHPCLLLNQCLQSDENIYIPAPYFNHKDINGAYLLEESQPVGCDYTNIPTNESGWF